MNALHPCKWVALALFTLLIAVTSSSAQRTSIDDAPITENPCITVGDLDFGTLGKGESRTLPLRICNADGGIVSFNNPSGGAVLEWLDTNFSVSAADIALIKNAQLGRGDCISINVTFWHYNVGTYSTLARFWASTRRCRDTSVWIARVIEPGPAITGYDWQERVVVGSCAKNDSVEYVSTIFAYNTADRNVIVSSIKLYGADAQFFELGRQPRYAVQIDPSDIIRPYDSISGAPKYRQTVVFRPAAERTYECQVVLRTTVGLEVNSTLRGVGIASHVQPREFSLFGEHILAAGSVSQSNDIAVRTEGTRDVTISDLIIVPDDAASAGQFTIVNRSSLIATHAKDSQFVATVTYAPTSVGTHSARLILRGDFSACDDSTTQLRGSVIELSARPWDVDFGSILTCFDSIGYVYVENTSSQPIQLVSVTSAHEPEYSIAVPNLPVVIQPGEKYPIEVSFSPSIAGVFNRGMITFDVRDMSGMVPVLFNGGPVTARFHGEARTTQLASHIARDYIRPRGTIDTIEVVIDDASTEARIDELTFTLRFRQDVLQLMLDMSALQGLVNVSVLSGWTITMPTPTTPDPMNDSLMVLFIDLNAPAGKYLDTPGTILKIPFLFHGSCDSSTELTYHLVPKSRAECVTIASSDGFAQIDKSSGDCVGGGSNLRDVRITHDAATHELVINFVLLLDGAVIAELYNMSGERVISIDDVMFPPGSRTLRVGTGGLAVGQYYLRLVSGSSEIVNKIMLVP